MVDQQPLDDRHRKRTGQARFDTENRERLAAVLVEERAEHLRRNPIAVDAQCAEHGEAARGIATAQPVCSDNAIVIRPTSTVPPMIIGRTPTRSTSEPSTGADSAPPSIIADIPE